MKKLYFIAIITILFVVNINAQEIEFANKNYEGIDNLVDDKGMGQSFRESIWSLSSKNHDWKRPVKGSNGRWEAKGFNHSNSSISHTYGGITYGNDKPNLTKFSNKKSNHDAVTRMTEENVARENRINAWKAELRQKAEKKRIENRRDYLEGSFRHKSAMSGFYQMKYARDFYMATEGVKFLDNFHATEMVNAPKNVATITSVNTMSGGDMANMLKKEKNDKLGSITFLSGPTMTTCQEMDKDDLYIETDKPSLDGAFVSEWSGAMESAMPSLNLPLDKKGNPIKPKKEKLIKPIMILSHEELDLDTMIVYSLPKYGPVVALQDSMVVLSDPELHCVSWNCGYSFSYIIGCGGRVFAKSDYGIVEVKAEGVEDFLIFDAEEFSIFPGSDNCFYIIFWYMGYDGELSSVYRIELNGDKKNVEEIARVQQNVRSLAARENEVFLLVDDGIILKLDQEGVHKFYESKDIVNDIALLENKLYVATPESVTSIDTTTNQTNIFYGNGVVRLWINLDNIYALDNMHDLWVFPNVLGKKK